MFQLDAQLAADSRLIASLASSDWLLMNDSRFVWLAQVPRFSRARLLADLPKGLRDEVRAESDLASRDPAILIQSRSNQRCTDW